MRRGFLCLLALLQLQANAQFFSGVTSVKTLETSGLRKLLEGHCGIIPHSLEFRQLNRQGFPFVLKQYEVYHFGYRVSGNAISVMQKDQKVIYAAYLDSRAVFEPMPVFLGNAEWVRDSLSAKYRLLAFTDSMGFRLYSDPATGVGLWRMDLHRYNGTDTWTNGLVFLPDPLSPQDLWYGGNYRDRGDSTYAEVEAEQRLIKLFCRFENDSFRLENAFIRFRDVTPPLRQHTVSAGDMKYTRNDFRFEEVNVFYHLQEMFLWLDALGLDAFKDTVDIDVHAYFGADESGFDPSAKPPTIEFGDGGVDDAEDADAAVHEYTHAIFNHAIQMGYQGTQRRAMEEGICDFVALCYSQRITENQPGWVYNWDGHNEFWEGRNLKNDRIYPASLTNQEHVDGQLFGAALYDLAREVGGDSVVKLLFYAMPLMVPNLNMRQGADILLQVDSVFFGSRFNWPLVKALHPRGLLPNVNVQSVTQNTIILRNSLAFAQGTGDLEIIPLFSGKIQVMDITGRTLLSLDGKKSQSCTLPTAWFGSGSYMIVCNGHAYKVLKF